jgi:hypothetical protein
MGEFQFIARSTNSAAIQNLTKNLELSRHIFDFDIDRICVVVFNFVFVLVGALVIFISELLDFLVVLLSICCHLLKVILTDSGHTTS